MTNANTGRCESAGVEPDPTSTDVEPTSVQPDSGASNSDASDESDSSDAGNEDAAAELTEIETVSFGAGECSNGSWCWVTPLPIGENFNAIGGSPDGSTIVAVGDQGACAQYDAVASTWTLHRSTKRGNLIDVEVKSATEVWVAGEDGVDFYDGAKWERQLVGWTSSLARGPGGELWAINGDALYAFKDGSWQVITPTIDGTAVFPESGGVAAVVPGEAEGEFWALTFQDHSRPYFELEVLHFDGVAFSKLAGNYAESYWPALALYQGKLYFADGSNWFDVAEGWVAVEALPGQWTTVADKTIAIRDSALFEVGTADIVRSVEVPAATSLWGANSEDLWVALSGGGLMRVNYDTGETSDSVGTTELPWHTTSGIEWSASATDAWRGPELEHFDGTTWTKVTTEEGAPYVDHIIGSGPSDVWFLGSVISGVWHWDGSEVSEVQLSDPEVRIPRVHPFDAETLWVAELRESSATIQQLQGDSWTELKTWTFEGAQFPDYIVEISGSSATDAYVALRDHVEHFDGENWETVFVAPDDEVLVTMVAEGERVWVLGEDSIYQRGAGGEWQPQWYGFQAMGWIGLTPGSVWLMGGWLSSGVLRLNE